MQRNAGKSGECKPTQIGIHALDGQPFNKCLSQQVAIDSGADELITNQPPADEIALGDMPAAGETLVGLLGKDRIEMVVLTFHRSLPDGIFPTELSGLWRVAQERKGLAFDGNVRAQDAAELQALAQCCRAWAGECIGEWRERFLSAAMTTWPWASAVHVSPTHGCCASCSAVIRAVVPGVIAIESR